MIYLETLDILLIISVLGVLLFGIKFLQKRFEIDPEVARKFLHTGMGLTCLTIPALFETTLSVIVLTLSGTAIMALVRMLPALNRQVGSVLYGVKRLSWGEIYFSVGVLAAYLLAGDQLMLYTVAVLVLTFADPAAALFGQGWGRTHYRFMCREKTVEGSYAFFVVAFIAAAYGLWNFTPLEPLMIISTALLVSILAATIEAGCGFGTDNFMLPVFTVVLLRIAMSLSLEAQALALAFICIELGIPVFMTIAQRAAQRAEAQE